VASLVPVSTGYVCTAENYHRQNTKIKDDMVKAKIARDEMIEIAIITMISCQIELFTQTADSLNVGGTGFNISWDCR
jgi:hypothetical protein